MTLDPKRTDDWSALHLVLEQQHTRLSVLQDCAQVLDEVVGDGNWFVVDMPFLIGGTAVPGLELGFRCPSRKSRHVVIERVLSGKDLAVRLERASDCEEPWVLSRDLHPSTEAHNVFAELLALGSTRACTSFSIMWRLLRSRSLRANSNLLSGS